MGGDAGDGGGVMPAAGVGLGLRTGLGAGVGVRAVAVMAKAAAAAATSSAKAAAATSAAVGRMGVTTTSLTLSPLLQTTRRVLRRADKMIGQMAE